jgi:hypothetical protein
MKERTHEQPMALAVPIHLKVKTQERLLVPRGCALSYESSFVGETLSE